MRRSYCISRSRSAFKLLTGNKHLGSPRRGWEENIRIDIKEVLIGVNKGNLIDAAHCRDYWKFLVIAGFISREDRKYCIFMARNAFVHSSIVEQLLMFWNVKPEVGSLLLWKSWYLLHKDHLASAKFNLYKSGGSSRPILLHSISFLRQIHVWHF